MTVVAVLERAPASDLEARVTAESILPGADAWFCADRLPPDSLIPLPPHERDQLTAHYRDVSAGVFFIVTSA